MRRFCAIVAVVALVFCAYGQNLGSSAKGVTRYAFSHAMKIVDGSKVWTNEVDEPWVFGSLVAWFPATTTNTITITRVRGFITDFQYWGNVITTNDMGQIETNYWASITNTVNYTKTNVIFTATVSNDADTVWNIGPNSDDLPEGVYQYKWDVFTFSVTPTSMPVLFDALR